MPVSSLFPWPLGDMLMQVEKERGQNRNEKGTLCVVRTPLRWTKGYNAQTVPIPAFYSLFVCVSPPHARTHVKKEPRLLGLWGCILPRLQQSSFLINRAVLRHKSTLTAIVAFLPLQEKSGSMRRGKVEHASSGRAICNQAYECSMYESKSTTTIRVRRSTKTFPFLRKNLLSKLICVEWASR